MNQKCILLILLFVVFLTPQILDAQELIPVANGFMFTEGPVWKDGALYFSDIQGDKIYRWSADSGTTIFRDPSGRSNGLTLDLDGNIIIAGHSARHVARLETKDSITIIASDYNGKKFNSPNDLVVKSDGAIFFTDPTYGLNDIGGTAELDFCGIYRINPLGGVQLLDASLSAPNGICFSPDESLLYVAESNPFIRKIYVWDVVDDSIITNKRDFAYISTPNCYLDGMKVDDNGRLYSCGILGVVVFEPDGTPIDTIDVPGSTTNCNWGDKDGKTLYITSGNAVYKYRKTINGFLNPSKKTFKSFRLNYNYPNPFNPTTTVTFTVPIHSFVTLEVFDSSGRTVGQLISDRMIPGTYSQEWNAEGRASGTYFVRLQAGSYIETRKVVLVK